MKKLSFIVMLACLGFFAASCSDDDDNDVPPSDTDYAQKIVTTYGGDLIVQLPEGDKIENKSLVNIDYASKNKINLVLKNFTIKVQSNVIEVGTIELKDVEVIGKDNVVIIQTKEFKEYPLEGLSIKATIVVKGGAVEGDKLNNLELDINEVFPPASIKVSFNGEKNILANEAIIKSVKAKGDAQVAETILDEKSNKITLNLKEGVANADLKDVELIFEVSDKATTAPVLTDKVAKFDLTSGSSKIEVVSENGIQKNTYTIVANTYKHSFKYDMEEWVEEIEQGAEVGLMVPIGGWGTSNVGVHLILGFNPGLIASNTNVDKTDDANLGDAAVKLQTIDTKGGPLWENAVPPFYAPKVTPASLFTGYFEPDIANNLKSTKFGIPFEKKPITFKGYYKYTPGKVFYRGSVETPYIAKEEDTKDKCAINAFLYEITDDKDAYITGLDTYKDPRIVATAMFESDGADKYTEFNKAFEFKAGKTFDKSKKYRIAIVASSSSQGDTFSGAPGSTLYLDDVEIIAE